jgi:hypothetical protein
LNLIDASNRKKFAASHTPTKMNRLGKEGILQKFALGPAIFRGCFYLFVLYCEK